MHGKQSVGSVRGESSHQEHPFIALLSENATQDTGEVYGMHFVYSGNFLAQAELSQFDSIRMTMGIHPENFVGHIYYGKKLQYTENAPAPLYLMRTGEAPFVPSQNNRERVAFLESFPMEYPGNGLGDYRESAVSIRTAGGHVGVQLN